MTQSETQKMRQFFNDLRFQKIEEKLKKLAHGETSEEPASHHQKS